MGNLTTHAEGTPVCSFQSNAAVPIESLRAYFTPRQSGSGDPSPSNVRAIEGWTGLNVYKDDMYLPVEYQRVEYLECTGTQWIATNYVAPADVTVEWDYAITASFSGDKMMWGAKDNDSTSRCYGELYSDQWYCANGNVRYYGVLNGNGTAINGKYHVKMTSQSLIVDDVSSTNASLNFLPPTHSIYIFAWNNNGTVGYIHTKLRLYNLIFYNGSTLSAHFVPCLRRSDSKPGMYDTVSNTFYTNSGTGEFLYGAAIGETIPITFPVLGKNKLNNDPTFWEVGSMGATGGKDNRTTRIRTIDFIDAVPNTTYTISISEGYSFAWNEFLSGTHKYYYGWQSGSYTFTTHSDINQLFFIIKKDDSTDIVPSILSNDCHIQLELGSTATAYEPYSSNNMVYGGYVDVAKGILHITGVKSIIDETVTVKSFQNRTSYYRMSISNGNYGPPSVGNIGLCFSYLKTGNTESWAGWINAETGTLQLCFPTTYDTQEKALAYLKDNPLEVYYHVNLTDPNYEYPLTPTQLSTLMNSNFIWSSTNDTITVDSQLHDSKYIAAAKKRIAANEPHIATASGNIATFSTDMKAPLRSCKVNFLPIQAGSGDPSPENIRAISGWTGCSLFHTNKQVSKCESGTINGNTAEEVESSNSMRTLGYSIVRPTLTYTFTVVSNNPNIQIYRLYTYNSSNQLLEYSGKMNKTSYTTIIGAAYGYNDLHLRFVLRASDGSDLTTADILNTVIEITDTAVNYSSSTPITLDWSSSGTIYGGYVDLVTGEVYKEYECFTLDGVNRWLTGGVSSAPDANGFVNAYDYIGQGGLSDLLKPRSNNTTPTGTLSDWQLICNRFVQNQRVANVGELQCTDRGDPYIRVYLHQSQLSDVSDKTHILASMKEWFSNNPVTICYKPIFPTLITTLTPTQLKSLVGTNNVWANTNGNTEVSYWRH